jgi:hypothetical protein
MTDLKEKIADKIVDTVMPLMPTTMTGALLLAYVVLSVIELLKPIEPILVRVYDLLVDEGGHE